ncbi:acyl-CoA dehydrogenase family protein [Micromonospora sp. DT53]|uniref:acyl-CoA dehydrogenase family protein n=1 Tax=Micromonospora sp. DT53 TaxID=3393444 RepID=UPI003CE8FFAA
MQDAASALTEVAERYGALGDKQPPGPPTAAEFRERWRELASLGFFRYAEQANDGAGRVSRAVAAIEAYGRAGGDPGFCYAATSQLFGIQFPLNALLNGAQRELLSGVADGSVMLCHASTETSGGSDPLSGSVRATPAGDGGYLLNGTKSFVTAAPVADLGLVFARTDEGRSPFAMSAFLVDLHDPSVTREGPFTKTALTGAPMGALTFTDTPVPAANLVGDEGAGLWVMSTTTTWERALLLSYALGLMGRLLDQTVEWCRTRRHFGRAMGSSHQVAARVAEMVLRHRRSRTMIRAMASRFDTATSYAGLATDAALTKISVSEDYVRFSQEAALLSGVRAFVADTGLTAALADPLAAMTYAGPNDLLRIAIARDSGLPVVN